jgi:hypothetical protein
VTARYQGPEMADGFATAALDVIVLQIANRR